MRTGGAEARLKAIARQPDLLPQYPWPLLWKCGFPHTSHPCARRRGLASCHQRSRIARTQHKGTAGCNVPSAACLSRCPPPYLLQHSPPCMLIHAHSGARISFCSMPPPCLLTVRSWSHLIHARHIMPRTSHHTAPPHSRTSHHAAHVTSLRHLIHARHITLRTSHHTAPPHSRTSHHTAQVAPPKTVALAGPRWHIQPLTSGPAAALPSRAAPCLSRLRARPHPGRRRQRCAWCCGVPRSDLRARMSMGACAACAHEHGCMCISSVCSCCTSS